MTEKVLVTGGVGFIGSHIVDKLVQEGFDVVVVDNLSTGDVQNVNSLARFYHADINNASFIFKKEQPDYVAHHAAQINVRSSIDDPVNDAEQNIMKSLRLIELCRKFKTKKFVFASSGGTVYGNPDSLPAKEDAELKPLSPYGIAKATVERYLEFYFRNFGFEYIALRYANVYGPRQNPKGEAGVISVFINQMLNGQRPCIWGDGAQTRDFVYVDDVAEANLAAIRYTGQFRRFNIGYGEENEKFCTQTFTFFLENRVCRIIQD